MWPIFQHSRRMYIRHRSQWLLLPCPTMHCDRKHRSGRHWIQSSGLHRKLHGTRTTPGRHRINFRCSDWIFKYVPENILFKIFQLFYFYLKCTNFLLFEQTFCVLQLSHSSMLMGFLILFSTDNCIYKGQIYTQGQTWQDGCDYNCECIDASKGVYRCTDRSIAIILIIFCAIELFFQTKFWNVRKWNKKQLSCLLTDVQDMEQSPQNAT